jgi:CarD family transcriptional regulator
VKPEKGMVKQDLAAKFKVGEVAVHPAYGAGVVAGIKERQRNGNREFYYTIELLDQPGTNLIVPFSVVGERGVRRPVSKARLEQLWHTLNTDPTLLPSDYRTRYKLLIEKLHDGNPLKLVEALRDMAWRRQRRGSLTDRETELYKRGVSLLAGEVAATQDIDVEEARHRIRERLVNSTQGSLDGASSD